MERVGGAGGVGLHEERNDGNWPHSFRGARSLSFKLFEMSRVLQEAAWRGTTFSRDFEAVLVLLFLNLRPGLKLEASGRLRIVSFKPERDDCVT